MPNETHPKDIALESDVAHGLHLIESGQSLEKGMAVLQAAANRGSDEAKYRLGWLYMQDKPGKSDRDLALTWLEQVSGEYALSANILIGVIYGLGSPKQPPDLKKAAAIFNETVLCLDQKLAIFKAAPPSSKADLLARQRYYDDWTVLNGYAKKLGISLNK